MGESITEKVERAAVDAAVSMAMKHVGKKREEGMLQLLDIAHKVLGDTWPERAWQNLRGVYENPDSKWCKFTNDLFANCDHGMLRMAAMNLGYEAGFHGFKQTQENAKKYGCSIPYVLLFDPTSACNLHCTGCWSAEYGHKLNLTYDDMDSIVTQAEDLGIHAFFMTGGEPTVRQKDIWELCKKHNHSYFTAYTNGTLIDDAFCEKMLEVKNFMVAISLEGFEKENDSRRGAGDFQKVMAAMDRLKAHKIPFGLSVCYTSANYKTVTSDEFLDMVIDHGVKFIWYFHYMPVGCNASTGLLLDPDQREYMYHRVREIRNYEGGKPVFAIDFQNDGEFIRGCIAGGKYYCHINPAGDVEPCVFIHYSSANIHDKTLLECFQQPLFKLYQQAQPFNSNHLRPCPMLENPEKLRQMVAESGAKSTDLEAPESVEHLCAKCDAYAETWAKRADQLWEKSEAEKAERKEKEAAEAAK